MARKPESPQQRAAGKARKRAKKGAAPGFAPGPKPLPLIIPGTRTAQNQLVQSRRWLMAEKEATSLRFHPTAIKQIQLLFHGDPEVRALMSIDRLSDEAKLAIKTLEDERAEAVAAGNTGDWWRGERRKGVTVEQQMAGGADRRMMGDLGMAMEKALSVRKGKEDVGEIEIEPDVDLEGDDVDMRDA